MLILTLAILALAPAVHAGPDVPAAPAPTPPPLVTLPVAPPSRSAAPAGIEAASAVGISVSADLRASYLTGFPVLVSLTVTNTGATAQTFPNLAARPHLVHFTTTGPKGKSERHTSPPEVEPTAVWTLPPGSSQRAILEIQIGRAHV